MHDFHDYAGQRVLIVGGGDSAVDWALHLHRIATDVTLIHRRDEFRAHEDSVRKAREAAMVKTLIVVGFGEAAIAINHIAVYLDPKKKISPGHSSSA